MIAVQGTTTVFAGVSDSCGNCGSFVGVPADLPYVASEADSIGGTGELIHCPQCCTAWSITYSNTREAHLSLAYVQNEHRRGRSNHLADYGQKVATGDVERDPAIDQVLNTLAAITAAERAHAEACAVALRGYSLRELESATGIKRATLARRGKVGETHALPAEIDYDDVIGF